MSGNAAIDRKLRPVYDALSARNYKGVLKLCSRKDVSKDNRFRVLKALSLERLGRSDEALALCAEVRKSDPVDLSILNTLTTVYKYNDRVEDAIDAYERAYAKEPANDELSSALFFVYARQALHGKQQKLAMKLYKKSKQPKFLFWAVTCMAMQADEVAASGDAKKGAMLLGLGSKLLQRALGDPANARGEAVRLHVDILLQQGQRDDALAVLTSPLVRANFPHMKRGAVAPPPEDMVAKGEGQSPSLCRRARAQGVDLRAWGLVGARR